MAKERDLLKTGEANIVRSGNALYINIPDEYKDADEYKVPVTIKNHKKFKVAYYRRSGNKDVVMKLVKR